MADYPLEDADPGGRLDRLLLQRIQIDFPLAADPAAELGAALGAPPGEVQARLDRWRREGLIRRVGPIFDLSALGWRATLCAVACPPAALERVSAVLARLEYVTHAYLREVRFGRDGRRENPSPGGAFRDPPNLWFTVTAPSAALLERRVAEAEEGLALGPVMSLPSRRTFKIRAVFGVEEASAGGVSGAPAAGESDVPSPLEDPVTRLVVAATQGGLPPGPDPFGGAAERVGLDRRTLIEALHRLRRRGVVRRVAAILDQRRLGLMGNCLTAWRVPGERVEPVGRALACEGAVSHCYKRGAAPGWPYNVYSMLHGRDEGECRRLVDELTRRIGVAERVLLFTRREVKKSPPRYV